MQIYLPRIRLNDFNENKYSECNELYKFEYDDFSMCNIKCWKK